MAESSETEQDLSSSSSENSSESSKDNVESSTSGSDNDNIQTFADEILPYQNEPLASTSDSDDADGDDEGERDEDGLTPSILEQRYKNKDMVTTWCSCNMCSHETLISAREFRCCREVDCAIGKLMFDFSIERISCVTQHPDYHALTNSTVLSQVAPLLKDKRGKSYRRKGSSAENEFLRAVAYRWLVRWIFGCLGWENSRPLPACVYHNVRTRYSTEQKTGYKSAEERD